jgi:transcriptional regulator with XRE-family HTH domain
LAGVERLKQYLADQSLTQVELAERMGVSQPTISDWLSGKTSPSAKKLKELSSITGVSIDELLGATPRLPSALGA